MKLLITGGSGFLGSNLAADALEHGDDLMIFDNLQRTGSRDNLLWLKSLGSFRFEHGDVRNENDITRVIRSFGPDAIFHLAGQVAMTTSISNPRMDFEVNALGTLNLLEAVRQHAPEAVVIYSSTNKVYGDLNQYNYEETDTRYICKEYPQGFGEDTALDFQSPYGCSKGAADQYMLDYAKIFSLKTIVFRHSSMYGGRQFATYDQGWISWFCDQAIQIKKGIYCGPIEISGNGKQVRDVLHANDVKKLYRRALESAEAVAGLCFNIGGGYENSLSLLELFKCLESILDIRIQTKKLPFRVSDQKIFVANTARARELLGWSQNVSKSEGLSMLLSGVTSSTTKTV